MLIVHTPHNTFIKLKLVVLLKINTDSCHSGHGDWIEVLRKPLNFSLQSQPFIHKDFGSQ